MGRLVTSRWTDRQQTIGSQKTYTFGNCWETQHSLYCYIKYLHLNSYDENTFSDETALNVSLIDSSYLEKL